MSRDRVLEMLSPVLQPSLCNVVVAISKPGALGACPRTMVEVLGNSSIELHSLTCRIRGRVLHQRPLEDVNVVYIAGEYREWPLYGVDRVVLREVFTQNVTYVERHYLEDTIASQERGLAKIKEALARRVAFSVPAHLIADIRTPQNSEVKSLLVKRVYINDKAAGSTDDSGRVHIAGVWLDRTTRGPKIDACGSFSLYNEHCVYLPYLAGNELLSVSMVKGGLLRRGGMFLGELRVLHATKGTSAEPALWMSSQLSIAYWMKEHLATMGFNPMQMDDWAQFLYETSNPVKPASVIGNGAVSNRNSSPPGGGYHHTPPYQPPVPKTAYLTPDREAFTDSLAQLQKNQGQKKRLAEILSEVFTDLVV